MREKITSEMISRRRAFSLLGLGAALGFAVPTTVLTMQGKAHAAVGHPLSAGSVAGVHRRHERREQKHGHTGSSSSSPSSSSPSK